MEDVVSRVPADYRHAYEVGGTLYLRCQSVEDVQQYAAWMKANGQWRRAVWNKDVYPRAFFWLAYLAVQEQDFGRAIEMSDRGLKLAPECSRLATEKAHALIRLGRLSEAKQIYEEVLGRDGFVLRHDRAVCLRGKGYVLIEESNLTAAEIAFRQSLEYEPDSDAALQELCYIEKLRQRA